MPELDLRLELTDDELIALRYAAEQASLSLSDFLVSCGLSKARIATKAAEKRVQHLAEPQPLAYVPENSDSPWVQMLGSARGLYASPGQAVGSIKASRQ